MATSSPSPNSSPSATPPTPSPPPATSNSTSPTTSVTPPITNATSPTTSVTPPTTNATSPQSPPPPLVSPPPVALAPPPRTTFSPPPPPTKLSAKPPLTSPPPPTPPSLSPPPSTSPPSSPNPPPSSPNPPPPPSSFSPPPPPPSSSSSPPPPAAEQPTKSPPPPSKSPSLSPPVAASPPPLTNSPPPPSSNPPENPSPPPSANPTPPKRSPPPPPGTPEIPISSPSPSQSPPSTTFSPPPPSRVQFPPPPGNSTTNTTGSNAPTNSTGGNAPDVSSSSGGNGGLSTGGVVAIVAVLGLVLLGVIGIAVCFVRRRKRKNSRSNGRYILPTSRASSPQSDSGLLKGEASASRYVSTESELVSSPSKRGILGNSRALFTFEELVQATNDFSEQNLLGEGGFGSVYKGYLPDGTEVAVKQLKIGGGQGEREFKAEVEIISRIHHRHLVSLAGYCIWETKRLLVYEYVPNNNLHYHLHEEGRPVMEWAMRVKIAAGAARGIAYLHEDCHPRVIHRDIKSSNILLDKNFEARVSDFGLAKLAVDANTHISTRVVGTFGYMAPEYASSGKLTDKSDVFSFGVVLLELITGRKPVDTSQPLGDESLVEWARPLLNQALETEEFEGLADPKLDKNYVGSEMLQMVEVAAACVRHSAVKRPRMGQVVRAFESMVASDITNGVPVGDSEIYNTAPQSSEIRWFRRMAFGNQDFTTDFFNHDSGINRSRSFADEL